MPPALKTLLWVIVLLDTYVLVYYRLMVKRYYEQAVGVREGAFWTLLSFPPYTRLPESGKKYARRYWIALAVMLACIAMLAWATDFAVFRQARQAGQ